MISKEACILVTVQDLALALLLELDDSQNSMSDGWQAEELFGKFPFLHAYSSLLTIVLEQTSSVIM